MLLKFWKKSLMPFSFAEDGAGGGGGEGSGGDGSKGGEGTPETVSKADFDKLQEDLTKVKSDLEEAQDELLSPEYLNYKRGGDKPTGDPPPKKPEGGAGDDKVSDIFGPLTDEQINAMSFRQFGNMLTKSIIGAVQQSVIPEVDKRFQSVEERTNAEKAESDLKFCMGVNDKGEENVSGFRDFYNTHRKLMIQVATDHPTLSVEDVYHKTKRQVDRTKTEQERIDSAKGGAEKPGSGASGASGGPKEFKDSESAAADAYESAFEGK